MRSWGPGDKCRPRAPSASGSGGGCSRIGTCPQGGVEGPRSPFPQLTRESTLRSTRMPQAATRGHCRHGARPPGAPFNLTLRRQMCGPRPAGLRGAPARCPALCPRPRWNCTFTCWLPTLSIYPLERHPGEQGPCPLVQLPLPRAPIAAWHTGGAQ